MRALGCVLLLALGCQSSAGGAWKACEIGKLPTEAQTALATGEQIAMNPGSAVGDLEAAGLSFLPGQFECAMAALVAWIEKQPTPSTHTDVMAAASIDAQRWHALDLLHAYLAAHRPVACAPGARM